MTLINSLLTLLLGPPGPPEPRWPSVDRLRPGQIVCNLCRGTGSYLWRGLWSLGPEVGCHRCIRGVTTPERQRTAEEWENRHRTATEAEKDEIMVRYRAARIEPVEN